MKASVATQVGNTESEFWTRNQQQIVRVGAFFDAKDTVEVSQAHLMADPESLGETGIAFLEDLAALPDEERLVKIPAVTDPRGVDFAASLPAKQRASATGEK